MLILRVNVRTVQSGAEQGSAALADFHISYTVFHANPCGAVRCSKINYCRGLRYLECFSDSTSGKIHNFFISEPNSIILSLVDNI